MRIAIVDDAVQDRDLIQKFISEYSLQQSLMCSIDQYPTGTSFLQQYKKQYDIVFMDIEMPDMDGLETARQLRQKDEHIILVFVTQMAQYAVNGYEVEAMDYLVKPVQYYSFEMTFRKAINRWRNSENRRLSINTGEKIYVLDAKEIYWVEVFDHYLTYHTARGDFVVKGTIGNVKSNLPEKYFFQCSRHSLINLSHITAVKRDRLLIGHDEIDVSRSKRKEVMEAVMGMFGGEM